MQVHPLRVSVLVLACVGCEPTGANEAAPDGATTTTDTGTSMTPCTAIAATPHARLCSVTRSASNPLIAPATHPGISNNITMPSVVRMPAGLAGGFGEYWMYFAAHDGHYIRLAHASAPTGPWTTYVPGTLRDTEVAPFSNTISSPDVLVLPSQRVRMYFSTDSYPGSSQQWSGVSESTDGIAFTLASTVNIAKYYMRVFEWGGVQYALQKGWSTAPAELGASPDGIERFAFIKTLAGGSIRHMAVVLEGSTLLVFYSKIGDVPERILLSTIRLDAGAPATWDLSEPVEVLRPELPYEGAGYPIAPSVKGPATNVNQLRDPYVLQDGGKTYLFYGIAGESGIAVAELRYQLIE
ncbi:MAG TPA: hypothetical protein VIV11_36720 [Kofleriaceae bacterium]